MAYRPRPPERLVIKADEVAAILGYRGRDGFSRERRLRLEAAGFPRKVPGLNGWSRPAIERWLEANGDPEKIALPEAANRPTRLERRFAS